MMHYMWFGNEPQILHSSDRIVRNVFWNNMVYVLKPLQYIK